MLSLLRFISSRHLSLLRIEAKTDINQMKSRTEKTFREHNPRDVAPNRILVKGNDGALYPKNPDTNYVSQFLDIFRGCLDCGSVDC